MKDIPTPEHDALFGKCNEKSLLDELCMVYELAQSLEKRLGLAVDALESIAADSEERFIRNLANAALKEIGEKK